MVIALTPVHRNDYLFKFTDIWNKMEMKVQEINNSSLWISYYGNKKSWVNYFRVISVVCDIWNVLGCWFTVRFLYLHSLCQLWRTLGFWQDITESLSSNLPHLKGARNLLQSSDSFPKGACSKIMVYWHTKASYFTLHEDNSGDIIAFYYQMK